MSTMARTAVSTDALQTRDFDRISAYVYKECGIKLPPAKITMIEGRLRRRVRATGLSSLSAYCSWLFEGHHLEDEREHLLNAVTTNKTDFFREPKHFDYLMGTVMPQLRDEGRRRKARRKAGRKAARRERGRGRGGGWGRGGRRVL